MFENLMAHIDTILIIITLVGGYRLLKSDLTEIINQSHKGLKEEIKQCEGKIEATEARLNNRFDDMITSIKELDKKTNEVSNKVSHIEGRLDQLFPTGVNKTAA